MSVEVTLKCDFEGCNEELEWNGEKDEAYELQLNLIRGPGHVDEDKFKVDAHLCEKHAEEVKGIVGTALDSEKAIVKDRRGAQSELLQQKKDKFRELLRELRSKGAIRLEDNGLLDWLGGEEEVTNEC